MKNILGYLIPLLLMLVIGILMWRSGEDLTRRWLPRFVVMLVAVFGVLRALIAGKRSSRKEMLNSHGELVTRAFTGKGRRALRRRFEKAVLLYDKGNARQSRDELLKLEPECAESTEHAALYYMLGVVYTALCNEAESIRFYRNSVAHVPDNRTAWSNLGLLLSRFGQNGEAIECLNKAIECDPNHGITYNNLATVHYRMGEYEKCISCLEKALELSPKLRQAAESMSCAYLQLGNEEKCAEYCTIAVSLGAGRKDMEETLDEIRKSQAWIARHGAKSGSAN